MLCIFSVTSNGGPPNPNANQRRRNSKSSGIYLRLMNAASRSRKDSLSSITSVMAEDSIRSQADIGPVSHQRNLMTKWPLDGLVELFK